MQRFKRETYIAGGMKEMTYLQFASERQRWPQMDWNGKFVYGACGSIRQAARFRDMAHRLLSEVRLGATTVIDGRASARSARLAFEAARNGGVVLP